MTSDFLLTCYNIKGTGVCGALLLSCGVGSGGLFLNKEVTFVWDVFCDTFLLACFWVVTLFLEGAKILNV